MAEYTQLIKIADIKDMTLASVVRENLIEFFNWGLLNVHGYADVTVASPGTANPKNHANLFMVTQPQVANGKIWQAVNGNWVWETGLESGDVPQEYTGVYINGVFYPKNTTGVYKHYVDYTHGRIVFDASIPTTSVVQAAHAHRWLSIYDHDVPWFRSIVLEFDDQAAAGFASLLQNNQIKLPALVVESVPRRRFRPVQIGGLSQWVSIDFLFHILAETDTDLTTIVDIVTSQYERTIYLYDANARAAANAMSLDWRGALNAGAKTYPDLVKPAPDGFRWKILQFGQMNAQESGTTLPVFKAVIRVSVTVAN